MQCNSCKKWRIVPYEIFVEFKDKEWHCSDLKCVFILMPDLISIHRSNTTCMTTQRKVEVMGVTYASGENKGFIYSEVDSDGDLVSMEEDATPPDPAEPDLNPELQQILRQVERDCVIVKRDTDIDPVSPIQEPGEDLSAFASRVACRETLEKLANLPPRSNVKIMQALDVTSDRNPGSRDLALSSLELARQVHLMHCVPWSLCG